MLQHVLTNYILPLLIYVFITGLANLLLAHRSQIESWAEANPRYAGYLKFQRAIGFDPWSFIAAVSLWAKKRLPDAQQNGVKAVAALVEAESVRAPRMFPSEPPPSFPPAALLLLAIAFAFHAQACSSAPQKPPCDAATITTMTAECSAVAFQCGAAGIAKEDCAAIDACKARLDARAEACR